MDTSFQERSGLIRIAAADPQQSPSNLRVEFHEAPPTPSLGTVPAQVGEVILSQSTSGQSTLRVSLGKDAGFAPEIFRQAGGALGKWLVKSGVENADLDLEPIFSRGQAHVSALLEGILLGAYQFTQYKNAKESPQTSTIFLWSTRPDLAEMIQRATKICAAVNLARDWAHEPANVINPLTLSERVKSLAKSDGLDFKVFDEAALTEMGAGGLLNVGKGSDTPPRLIIIEYAGSSPKPDARPVIFVGKAITFDTGGYSLKSTEGIKGMKYDKCGGTTVAALLHLVSRLAIQNPVIGIISAAENMVSSNSYRPDDIIKMLSGKTVEITSTDAEGRLVLADAIAYAQNSYNPQAIIDLATLTGGVVVSLGHVRAGLMSNNDDLAAKLFSAGESTHERLWRLPLDGDFEKLLKGDDADLKNSGGREGHAILGGTFLKQFVSDDVPWAHLDIAGVAETDKELPYSPKGATGFGIRLLLEYLENL